MMKSILTAATALGLGSTTYAAIAQTCPSDDVCYSLSIPESTASSGDGEIYFQLSGPTSYQYIALGQGSRMSGSNMFIMYTSSDGNNVTVSPRSASGYSMPQHNGDADISLLEGSGVENGIMTANVRCGNCQSWQGGEMDLTASSAEWIYAVRSGDAINSDSVSENIDKHNAASSFTWQISQAQGGNSMNPFTSGGSSTNSGSNSISGSDSNAGSSSSGIPSTCTPITSSTRTGLGPDGTGCPTTTPDVFPSSRPAWVDDCYGGPNGAFGGNGPPDFVTNNKRKRDDDCPAGYESADSADFSSSGLGASSSATSTIVLAHGVLASLAFVALFPIGGIIIRVANFTGLVWIHAAIQMLSYVIYIIAFGLGIYIATQSRLINNTHPIIGIVLFIVLLTQPVSGWLHHRLFSKYTHRTFWSYMHLYQGRAAILLGMVNGGLGLQLARAGSSSIIAYSVFAGIMGTVYLACIIMGEMRRRRNAPPTYEKSQSDQFQMRDMNGNSHSDESSRNHGYYGKDSPRSGRS